MTLDFIKNKLLQAYFLRNIRTDRKKIHCKTGLSRTHIFVEGLSTATVRPLQSVRVMLRVDSNEKQVFWILIEI